MPKKKGSKTLKKKAKKSKSLYAYSKHALERMSERGVSKKLVEEVIIKAQKRKYQPHDTIEATYTQGQSELTVVYSKMSRGRLKIISTY